MTMGHARRVVTFLNGNVRREQADIVCVKTAFAWTAKDADICGRAV